MKVPLGQPLVFSDEELERLAQVTWVDIADALAFHRQNTVGDMRTLLEAVRMDEGEESASLL